jgi:hypothetical protein
MLFAGALGELLDIALEGPLGDAFFWPVGKYCERLSQAVTTVFGGALYHRR